MRKLREVLRLRLACGLSGRAIAQSCGLSGSTVSGYLGRITLAKLTWPLPPGLDDDAALERLLFPDEGHPVRLRPEPDWAALHRELRRPHVTKQLLWQEYREQHPDGYQYSQFCARYAAFARTLSVTMRQTYLRLRLPSGLTSPRHDRQAYQLARDAQERQTALARPSRSGVDVQRTAGARHRTWGTMQTLADPLSEIQTTILDLLDIPASTYAPTPF